MDEIIKLNRTNMYEYFRQTKEFVFLDEVEVIPGKSALGRKYVSSEEWYFAYHFPGNPIMPGVFQMEAMMQTGGLIVNTLPAKKELSILFDSAKNIKIFSMIRPEDEMLAKVELLSYRRGIIRLTGQVETAGWITAQMEFTLIAPSEVIRI